MSQMNPSATTAVRLGPGILGKKGYAAEVTARANTAGHIGLGARLRQVPASVAALFEEPPAPLASEATVIAQLKADPASWQTVLDAEAERPEGARRAVVQAVIAHSGDRMPAETVAGLRELFQLEG